MRLHPSAAPAATLLRAGWRVQTDSLRHAAVRWHSPPTQHIICVPTPPLSLLLRVCDPLESVHSPVLLPAADSLHPLTAHHSKIFCFSALSSCKGSLPQARAECGLPSVFTLLRLQDYRLILPPLMPPYASAHFVGGLLGM